MRQIQFSIRVIALCIIVAMGYPVLCSDVTVSNSVQSNFPFNPANIGTSDQTITVAATNGSATITSASLFPQNIVGRSGFQVSIGGTQYTVAGVASRSSLTLTTTYGGSTGSPTMTLYKFAILRIYSDQSFTTYASTPTTATVSVTSGSPTVTSAAAFPSAYVGAVGGFSVLINNVRYQVLCVTSTSSLTLTSNYTGTTGSTQIAFNAVSDVIQAGAVGSGTFFKEIGISSINPGSGNLLYYPSFIIPSTTDAPVNNTARYTFAFYNAAGGSLNATYACDGGITQMGIPPTTPTSFTNLCQYNGATAILPDSSTYTRQQIDSRFPACTAGQSYYFNQNGNLVSCLNYGSGLTLTGNTLSATGGGGGGTTITDYRGAINVSKAPYSCAGDGVSNDTACIAAAITAAGSAGTKAIYLPGGTYLVTGLVLNGPIEFFGDGDGKTIIKSVTNAPILSIGPDSNFVGPYVHDLQILGSVTAGSLQNGLVCDNGTYVYGVRVARVKSTGAGNYAGYIGNCFSSSFENVTWDNSANYLLAYNALNMPANRFIRNDFLGVRASAPVGARIFAGEFVCDSCNGLFNDVAGSKWAVVGQKIGVDGAVSNFGAVFSCNDCNFETFVSHGVLAYANSLVNIRGRSSFALAGSGSGTAKAIEFDLAGNGSSFFAEYISRGVIEDSVSFGNALTSYANNQAIHANGFAPIETSGYGPSVPSSAPLSTYYNSSVPATYRLSRKDGQKPVVVVTGSTTIVEPGIRYIEANCSAPCSIVLPYAGWYQIGQDITVKDISGSAATNNITISGSSGSTVNGSSYVISTNGQSVTLIPSLASLDWRVISGFGTSTPLTSTYVGFGSGSNLLSGSSNFTYDGTILTLSKAGGNPYLAINDTTNSITSRIGPLAAAPDRFIAGTISNHPFGLYANNAERWTIGTGGDFTPGAASAYSIGSSSFPVVNLTLSGKLFWNGSTVFDTYGSGSPEGVVTASVGSTYRRINGAAGTTLYVKETGSGNTGWTAQATGVTSLAGTANQITASASTGAVTLSLAGPHNFSTATSNGVAYGNGTGALQFTAAGGAGTLCLVSTNGAAPTFSSCSGSSGTALSAITNASGANTITNGDNAQVWQWQLTTNGKTAFAFSESTASTATSSYIQTINTLATSTAKPIKITAGGTTAGVEMSTTGVLGAIGTGQIQATPAGTTNSIQINNGGGLMDGGANAVLDLTTSRLTLGTSSSQAGLLSLRNASNSNLSTIQPAAVASTTVVTLPNATSTLATLALSETLTNKTLTTPTIADFTNAIHNHTNNAGGGQITDAALSSAVTVPKGGTGLTVGTSGGVPYFSATTTMASSGALTSNAIVLGGGAGAAPKVATGLTTDGTSKVNLGVAGASVGAVVFANATSGTITLQPVTGALGSVTLSLPAVTDTIVGRTTTDTLTNKTLTAPTINGGTHTAITSLGIRSTGSGAFDLTLANTENLTTGRTLTFTVNDAARTLNMGGNITTGAAFTTSGANALTLTTTGSTNVTFPTTGTLATLAGAETFTNKVITSATNSLGGVTMALGSDAVGDTYYNGAGGTLTRIPAGSNGQVFTISGGVPTWAAATVSTITVGTTNVAGGTTGRVLSETAGVLSEYAVTGTGNVVLSASPTLTGTAAMASLTASGTIVQTSASGAAFESGPNGSTNPVFRLVNSTASSATGVSITGAAAAAGATIAAISSGTNENLIVSGKGTGYVTTPGSFLDLTNSSTATGVRVSTGNSAGAAVHPGSGGGFLMPFVGGSQSSGPGIWWTTNAYNSTSGIWLNNGFNFQGASSTHSPLKIRKGTGTSSDGTVIFALSPDAGTIELSPFGTSAGNTSETRYLELAANGTNYTSLRAADSISANATIVLPSSASPSTNDVLTVTGVAAGVVTTAWQAPTGGGLADPGSNGVVVRTSSGVTTARTLTATTGISIGNGTGVSGDPVIGVDQSAAFVWTGLNTYTPSTTTPSDAIFLSINTPGSVGTRDSHNIVQRGTSRDGGGAHTIDWKQFVDVTSNAGVSSWTLQSRVDAASYATRLTVDDAGFVTAVGFGGDGSLLTNLDGTQITVGPVGVSVGGTGNTSYTKGDLLAASAATTLTKLGVGTNGQVLTADSSQTTGLKWSSAGTGTVTHTAGALTANSFVFGNGTDDIKATAAATNGQLLIGSTSANPVAATLTAVDGIAITNGAGSITVGNVNNNSSGFGLVLPSAGGLPVVTDSSTAVVGTANTVYVALINIPFKFTFDRVGWGGVIDSTGNFAAFGIYSANGNTLICDSGGLSTTAASWVGAKTSVISSCTLGPGQYYLAWTADSTTPTMRKAAAFTNYFTPMNAGSGTVLGTAANASFSGILPSTLGALTDDANLSIPIIRWFLN